MIPINYPNQLDNNTNLFLARDSIRLILLEDYLPGNKSIKVESNVFLARTIPSTGIITLTEQCSVVDERAISFYYGQWDAENYIFLDLIMLPEFNDVIKPKKITNVTMNVVADHHNNLKDSLISIQKFCGKKGLEDKYPFGETLEGRINFLRRLALQPKAWFTADKRTGNVPLEVEFQNMSFRLGTDGTSNEIKVTWDFGDQTTSLISTISTISVTDQVPSDAINVLVRDIDSGKVKKTFHSPGIYNVKLMIENDFGKDEVIFEDYINAKIQAPKIAQIKFLPNGINQIVQVSQIVELNKIRSSINTLISLEIENGEDPDRPGISYAGEYLNGSTPIDPIESYNWSIGDDLNHPNSKETKSSFGIGGIYDLKLRTDTSYGAYRITNIEDAFDIIENTNLWLWTIDENDFTTCYEYGLISETFKLNNSPTNAIERNQSFLEPINVQNPPLYSSNRIKEFKRNTGFSPINNSSSGNLGLCVLYWASGRSQNDVYSSENIKSIKFNGFTGTYSVNLAPDGAPLEINRGWNWANLNSFNSSYFVFGSVSSYDPQLSQTNTLKQTINLSTNTVSLSNLQTSNFLNGANELEQNVSNFDSNGQSSSGNYSVYRTAWKDNTGYILRNDGADNFFRLKSFYRTEGTLSNPFNNIRKIQDVQGPTKLEGELTDLSSGIYLLNNSGSVSKFSPDSIVWTSGGPGVNSLVYRNLQDISVTGYDSFYNSLLVTSDHDKRAYLSFDYSERIFLKFNEIDLTFSSLGNRPVKEQWMLGTY